MTSALVTRVRSSLARVCTFTIIIQFLRCARIVSHSPCQYNMQITPRCGKYKRNEIIDRRVICKANRCL